MKDGVGIVLGIVVVVSLIVVIAIACVATTRQDGICVGAGYDECVYEAEQLWCIRTNESGELIGVPYDTVLEQVTR